MLLPRDTIARQRGGDDAFFGATTAYTLGSYIIGGNELKPDVKNPLFQHEYGHYLQSQAVGWGYLTDFAIPSALNPSQNGGYTDISQNTEQDAQARALLYFTRYVDGFTYDDWSWTKNRFYDSPKGKILDRKDVTTQFLQSKLMITVFNPEKYIKVLIKGIKEKFKI